MDKKIIPLLTIGATIDKEITLDNFFSESSEIFNLLKDPPYVRYSGWNMLTLDYPKIKNGDRWEVTNGGRKTIKLYEDGSLITFAYANNEFLGWGQSDEDFFKRPVLNSLAIIEFIYEFVRFYFEFLKIAKIDTGQITFRLKLSNVKIENEKKLSIRTNNVLALFPESSDEIDSDKEAEITIDVKDGSPDVGHISYKIIAKIYLWFSVPENKIPYTSEDEKGIRYIDIKSFNKEIS